jgi:predicted RNA-binding Zn-ribbon protein involved in translation (DUF1610 family)
MDGHLPLEERRQSYCPECYDVRAEVTTVSHHIDHRTFTYKCPQCGTEFVVTTRQVLEPLSPGVKT